MTRKEQIKQRAQEVFDLPHSQAVFMHGAEWADKTMLEKACDYLWKHCNGYILTARDIEEFKQKMKE